MSADLQRRGLASDLTRRLQLASHDELRLADAALTAIEQARGLQWERRIATGPGDVDRLFHIATPRLSRGIVETRCRGSWPFADPVERQSNVPVVERCLECWRAVADHPISVGLLAVVEDLCAQDVERAELREAARREMFVGAERGGADQSPQRPALRDDVRSSHFAHCTFIVDQAQRESGFCARDGFTMEAHCEQCYQDARHPADDLAIAVEPARAAEWQGDLTRASNVPAQLALADVDQREPHEIDIVELGGKG